MNRYKAIKKISKIFVLLTMIFSMCFQSSNIAEVNAYDINVPKKFTRVRILLYYGLGGLGASDANSGLDGDTNDGLDYEETDYLYTHILLMFSL